MGPDSKESSLLEKPVASPATSEHQQDAPENWMWLSSLTPTKSLRMRGTWRSGYPRDASMLRVSASSLGP